RMASWPSRRPMVDQPVVGLFRTLNCERGPRTSHLPGDRSICVVKPRALVGCKDEPQPPDRRYRRALRLHPIGSFVSPDLLAHLPRHLRRVGSVWCEPVHAACSARSGTDASPHLCARAIHVRTDALLAKPGIVFSFCLALADASTARNTGLRS